MNRQEKKSTIDAVKDTFERSQASFVVETKGMDVAAIQQLRSKLFEHNSKMRVVKNTLLRRALADLPELAELTPQFKEQIAIVFAEDEPPAVAKILFETAKEGKTLVLRGGALDAKTISKEQVEYLANLPSKEILLAQLASTLQAPVSNFVMLLNQLVERFVRVLKEIEKTKH